MRYTHPWSFLKVVCASIVAMVLVCSSGLGFAYSASAHGQNHGANNGSDDTQDGNHDHDNGGDSDHGDHGHSGHQGHGGHSDGDDENDEDSDDEAATSTPPVVVTPPQTDTGTTTATTTELATTTPPVETTPTVIDTPAPPTGGGGNGPVNGFGINHAIVPTLGVVLGTSTETSVEGPACGPLVTHFLRMGKKNDIEDVKKLQGFLNNDLGLSLVVDGNFGKDTFDAVSQFQDKYFDQVLTPWLPHGLLSAHTTTGYVYKTTLRMINKANCASLEVPMPQLP